MKIGQKSDLKTAKRQKMQQETGKKAEEKTAGWVTGW